MDLDTLLLKNFIGDLLIRTCGTEVEIIKRPASYMVRNKEENDRDINRVIVLPPRGYTADTLSQTNSHDEAEYATIEIKGAVRDDKNGFSTLKDCLLVVSLPLSEETSELNKPYMIVNIDHPTPDLILKKHSAGESPFAVVKSDGYGFYHNLINLTDDWLVLSLYKRLRPQKSVNLKPHLDKLIKGQADLLSALYDAVLQHGDGIFKKTPKLIDNILKTPVETSMPALTEMLFVHDSGKHEACSVFAVILKMARIHPERVTSFLEKAVIDQRVPRYYAEQLLSKIKLNKIISKEAAA